MDASLGLEDFSSRSRILHIIYCLKSCSLWSSFGWSTMRKIFRRSSVKLLVSELLQLAKLILLVTITNAASERSGSTLCRVKTYLRSFMTEELLSSCLIVTTYKNQVDKLKLVVAINQFCFKNEHRFSIKEYILSQKVRRKCC